LAILRKRRCDISTNDRAERLRVALTSLAVLPDDAPEAVAVLRQIAELCVVGIPGAAFASITMQADGVPTTVATTGDIALAVDEAQYAREEGPCLAALADGLPVSVPQIADPTTVTWPDFRARAGELGLRSSLSIPLFAGGGDVVAALNLYARETGVFSEFAQSVLACYDLEQPTVAPVWQDGRAGLIAGLNESFGLHARIQRAVGYLASQNDISLGDAYGLLRQQAAATDQDLSSQATAVLTRDGGEAAPR
jgi:GAF domain-containing protein